MIYYHLFMDDFGNHWCKTMIDRNDGKGIQYIALAPAFVDHAPKEKKSRHRFIPQDAKIEIIG